MNLENAPVVKDDIESGQVATETVVPIIEETAQIEKRMRETGVVRVRKIVREHEERIETPLLRETAEVTRVPVNRVVEGAAPTAREEGDTQIIPVLEEVLFVEKRLMLIEEIHIRRVRANETQTQTVTLRRDEAVIERDAPETSPAR